MRNQVERLRVWLVAGASLLMLVVGGFLGYAHYRSRAFLAGLPGRLGVNVTRETNGYTFSRSTKDGRTIFTLRAAKMEQRKDGVVALHDVSVVVYGREAGRSDRIYGKEFEYDQNAGIVRALGRVEMDLLTPTPGEAKQESAVSAASGALQAKDARVIHVATNGLVYLTHLGVAATAEEIEFSEGGLRGRAHGADFNSDTGIVVLYSAVRVEGTSGGGPVVVTAGHAEFNRGDQVANLREARMERPAETVNAERAVVHLRKDGSLERIEGSDGVGVRRGDGGTLTALRGDVAMNAAGKAEDARFAGAVRYVDDAAGRRQEWQAADAWMRFDGEGRPAHVTMGGGVTMRTTGAVGTRVLTAATFEGTLVPVGGTRKTEMRDAVANGSARLVELGTGANGKEARTEMSGDRLAARFAGGSVASDVVGTGHTMLRQVKDGVDEVSSGDSTEVVFRPAEEAEAGSAFRKGREEVASAVQVGHVVSLRKSMRTVGGAKVPVEERATAGRAAYDGGTDLVTMTGAVVLTNGEDTVWGDRVVIDRTTGDATAEGGVRVTYLEAGNGGKESDPVHVLADRAELQRGSGSGGGTSSADGDRGLFYGSAERMARLWQGTSQVEAPSIEFDGATRRLVASGPGDGMQVHAVLVGAESRGGHPVGGGPKRAGGPSVVRIASRRMVYTDGNRQDVFSGGVTVEDADGRMRAEEATVFLRDKATAQGRSTAPVQDTGRTMMLGGSVDRVVATGRVEIEQPGRRGTGERLVYTADDQMFVLTGRAAAPPRMVDETRGTVMGEALRFHSGDDRISATSDAGAGKDRVRAETRVKP